MGHLAKARAAEVLKEFSSKRVLVIGDVMLDRYVFGRVERINPEAPSLVLNAETEKVMTGGAGNVAKNAATLGAETVLISVIGKDSSGQTLKKIAEDEGYRTCFITDESRSTTEKVRHVVGSHQLLRVDYESTEYLSSEIENQILGALELELDEGVDVIIISDYAKGMFTPKIASAVMKARKQGIFVAADVKPKHASYVVGVSLISPNKKEAHEFLGLNPLEHTKVVPSELAKLLHEKMLTESYVTLSAEGISVCTSEETGLAAQEHASEVFDVSGAGDTAICVLALARVSGATPLEAAALANISGAVVVAKVGAVSVSSDEILAKMIND